MAAINQLIGTDRLKSVNGYFVKVLPVIKKYVNSAAASMPSALKDPRAKKEKREAICSMDSLRCSSILVSKGDKAVEDYVEFIVSIHTLCHALDGILEAREMTDIGEIQQLYRPFSDCFDPDSPAAVRDEYCRSREVTACFQRLRDTCRNKISVLPNYRMVTGKMKKYARLYVELQSCKYQPLKIRSKHLQMWSDYYIRQFPEISFWEFAASADSVLGICAMFLLASRRVLSEGDVNKLDTVYMPWVCAYQKMLQNYVNAGDDIMTGRMNLTDFYENLKQCEERLRFLSAKALDSCTLMTDSSIHTTLVQALPVIYLSDPRACFGLNRLASRNLMKDSSPLARSIWNCSRLLNAFK